MLEAYEFFLGLFDVAHDTDLILSNFLARSGLFDRGFLGLAAFEHFLLFLARALGW